jgi:hypothetical protein
MAENVTALVMGLTVAVVAWVFLARCPRDWVRLLVAEAIVGAASAPCWHCSSAADRLGTGWRHPP